MEFSAQQIAAFLNGTVEGNPEVTVKSFSKIEEGKPGTLTFLANPKYEHFIYSTKASIVLVNNDFTPTEQIPATLIRVENAYAALAILLNMVEQQKQQTGIDSSAFIAPSASVGENCYIGHFAYVGKNTTIGKNCRIYPQAYIGDDVTIGDNCIIYPHVTIYDGCVIGNNNILHAGSVIGSDGFGFAPEGDLYKKIPQLGNVVLEDDVEIGANTCVDRATMGATVVKRGVKLDNLVQVAHNVEIGSNTVIASQTGIAGSAKIGEWCMFGGQVGVAGHIKVGDRVNVGAQSGIPGNTPSGVTLMGYPAIDPKQFARSSVIYKKLPEMYAELNSLKKEIENLKQQLIKE